MSKTDEQFLEKLMAYYTDYGRQLPWRNVQPNGESDPYSILVSELMLQQTQVERVIPKYESFLARFPNLESLAQAPLSAVIEQWMGLGYNRRALYLHQAAKALQGAIFPRTIDELVVLKGVSKNTAAALLTYAFNQKHTYVETNIRTVIIGTFFNEKSGVSDKDIEIKLEQLFDIYKGSYREFYWALMDYGTFMKRQGSTAHKRSSTYKKQSRFNGSVRQLRGQLLRRARSQQLLKDLHDELKDDRLDDTVATLVSEGFIRVVDGRLEIA